MAPLALRRVGYHLLGGAMDDVFPTALGLGQCVNGKLFFFGTLCPRAALIVGRRCNLLWLLRVFVCTAPLVLRHVGCHLIRGAILAGVFPTSRGLWRPWRASSHWWWLATSAGEESRSPSLYYLGCGGLEASHEARESKAVPFAVAAK
jgi:hypothetical protein